MRTEEDLKTVYRELADSSPDPSRVLAALMTQRPSSPRKWVLVGAATAAVVAVLVAIPFVLQQNSDSAPDRQASPSVEVSTVVSTVTVTSEVTVTAGMEEYAQPTPITAADADSVRLPFTIGYLPDGLRVMSVLTDTLPEGAALGLADDVGTQTPEPFGPGITIWVTNASDPNLVLCTNNAGGMQVEFTLLTIGEYTGCVMAEPGGLPYVLNSDIKGGHVEILIDQEHEGVYSNDQLAQIAASIVVSPTPDDESTWFDTPLG